MPALPIGIYPLSTQNGEDIPLDVVRPISLIYYDLIKDISKTINIPVGVTIAYILSKVDCLIRLENIDFGVLAQNNIYTNTIFVPGNIPISLVVSPGAGRIMPTANGKIYFSYLEQWASLSQPIQSNVG